MKIILYFYIYFIIFEILLCDPSCKEGEKNCLVCHPLTNLCEKCNSEVFKPDENGGCEYSSGCRAGINYCYKCKEKEIVCEICEQGYYPDESGGCSYVENCGTSFNGECLECKENYILIGNTYRLKFCKSLDSEDFYNCEKIDTQKGLCEICKTGYYLNSGDKKCIQTENCTESTYSICNKCDSGFYLDKKNNKCLKKTKPFINCMQTVDGKTCDICDDGYFFDSEYNCISTKYCETGYKNGNCKECKTGYYLSNYDKSCTTDKNCFLGIKDIGVCEICNDDYYMDFADGKCKSYKDDEDYKYCRKAEYGICYECIAAHFLGDDNKCSESKNCQESEKGKCILCMEPFHLGLDNICTNVEKCIYTSPFNDNCLECEDNYFYDSISKECIEVEDDKFQNCKTANKDLYCHDCKKDYYLNRTDNLCHSNNIEGKFYKCALTDINAENCVRCEENYFLSFVNRLCINTDGCNVAEDGKRCAECNEYHCLDLKTGKCEINQYIENENQKIYYSCNRTNKEGTKCEKCKNGFKVNKDGICIDDEHCIDKNDDGNCLKCMNDEKDSYCLNELFGCVELYDSNCVECNDIFNLRRCTKCADDYEVDGDGKCILVE